MATVVIKSYLEMPDLTVETRRFVVERANIDQDGIYDQVHGKVGHTFPDLKGQKFTLFWKDEDEDFVTVSTDEEIRYLLSSEDNGMCRIYIKVSGEEDNPMNTTEQNESAPTGKGTENHDQSFPSMDMPPPHPRPFDAVFSVSANHPPPPPPPPFFGPHPHGMFGGPFRGPFGGPWGWGRGRARHPHHHHHRHHGFAHHFPHHRMHHGHFHGTAGHHPHWGSHWGMHGGKDSLRNLVPMPHRRWAKGFIQSWRKENLKNATTTTSDSDGKADWKITMDDAGVPPAYAEWLKMKLVRWHKKWTSDEINEMDVGGEDNKMEKKATKALKTSVPKEFRQWTKRYLNTHFGRRDSPKFKKQHCEWKQDYLAKKKHALFAMVPSEQRLWTKNFIRDWRIEKKLDEPNTKIPSVESSYDCEVEIESLSVPDGYKQWLEIFLQRWHTWRGQLERNPGTIMRGGMGQFKDIVPTDYRAWVKHYMCVHYGKHKKSEQCREVEVDPSDVKYEKMLQAFQKKWLEKQQLMGSDSDTHLYMSSSEEETSKGEPETSFERLSINNDNGSKKAKVRFDDESDKSKAKKQKTLKMEDLVLLMDSDEDDEDTSHQRKVPMNPSFRHWTKQALYNWDGETVGEGSNTQRNNEGEEIQLPPNVYHWMSKMMMKMQMKKMKQQFKSAKREMKAAKKQQKHGIN